jgi:hypothetical protein
VVQERIRRWQHFSTQAKYLPTGIAAAEAMHRQGFEVET